MQIGQIIETLTKCDHVFIVAIFFCCRFIEWQKFDWNCNFVISIDSIEFEIREKWTQSRFFDLLVANVTLLQLTSGQLMKDFNPFVLPTRIWIVTVSDFYHFLECNYSISWNFDRQWYRF